MLFIPEGFVVVEELLHLSRLRSYNVEDIKRVVRNCAKQRFALCEKSGKLQIRANQGHTMEVCTDMGFFLF